MKKIILFLLAAFLLLFLPAHIHAQTDTGWVIDNFESEININKDTAVNVKETIQADFGRLAKHGIFRTIPVRYKTASNNNLSIRFKLLSVTDALGNKLGVSETNQGNNVQLKIGDADKLVTGKNTYVISYLVQRVVTTPNQQAELYWNVTGDAWPVSILSTKTVINTPEDSLINSICFTGVYGSTSQDCVIKSEGSKVTITSNELSPGEGLTFAVGLDKNKFLFPLPTQNIIWFLTDNWIYLTPVFVFLIMLRLYWTKGRDKEFRNAISEEGVETVPLFAHLNPVMAFAPPKNLSPGEVGVLIDEKIDNRDITAILIDLARRGYFKIKETKKAGLFKKSEFSFTLTNKSENGLNAFEKSVLDMLFGEEREQTVELNDLHKNAYKYLQKIKIGLYEHLTSEGYFAGNPQKVKASYFVIGGALIFIGFYVFHFLLVSSGIIVLLFAPFMPSRTPKGRKALEEIVGLKEYIRVGAWREKIYEKQNFFEEALAFTIVFGMTDKFIKAFKDVGLKSPGWYQSSGTFNPVYFGNSLNSIGASTVSAAAATAPRSASSGGSGFSGGGGGGGFGGGGGGSW